MQAKKKIRLTLFWVFFAMILGAQVPKGTMVLDSSKACDFEEYTVQHFTASNGLLQNTVGDIAMDVNHLLWLTSERGLSSYDGKSFKHFSGEGFLGRKLAFNESGQLLGSKFSIENSRVYRRDFRDSINVVKHGQIRVLDKELVHDSRVLTNVVYGTDGGFYLTLHPSTFYINNGDTVKLVDTSDFRARGFFYQNRMYQINRGGELQVFQNADLVKLYSHPLLEAWGRWLWCHSTSSFYFIKGGRLYRLMIGDGLDLKLEMVLKDIPVKALTALMVDEENNRIYLGTSNNGLYVLQKKQFVSRYNPVFGKWNNTYAQLEVGLDSVLSATGLLYTPNNIEKVLPYTHIKATNLVKDSTGKIWDSDGRLTLGQQNHSQIERIGSLIEPIPRNRFSRIGFGPSDVPILKLDEKDFIETIWGDTLTRDIRLRDKQLFYYDEFKNEMWVNHGRRMWIYDLSTKALKEVNKPEDWKFRVVYSVNQDITLVSIQDRGLKVYIQGEFVDLPLDANKHLAYTHCVMEDDNGFFWLSTNNGIFQLLKEELLAYVNGETDKLFYYWFGEDEGIEHIELNGACTPCAIKLSSGKFSFPALNGILQFNPDEIQTAKAYSDIIIRHVKLDGKDTILKEGAQLSQDVDQIEFFVSAPFYGHQANNYLIEYQLKGLSDDWYPMPEDGFISFSKLKYGEYTLVIRRKLGSGINNFASVEFSFEVPRYLYQTTGFRIILVLLILMGGVGTFWVRARISKNIQQKMEVTILEKTKAHVLLNEQLKLNNAQLQSSETDLKKEIKLREKLIELYAHQIRGPLKFMGDAAERNKDHIENMSHAELRKWFSAIADTSNTIYGQTERMFKGILSSEKDLQTKRSKIVLSRLMDNLLLSFERDIRVKNLGIEKDILEDVICFEDYNALVIVLNNLLSNAVTYTEEGHIGVEGHVFPDNAVLIIKDTGKGLPKQMVDQLNNNTYKAKKDQGFGLKISKMLLEEMGAYLQVESIEGKGTSISVFLQRFNEESIEEL